MSHQLNRWIKYNDEEFSMLDNPYIIGSPTHPPTIQTIREKKQIYSPVTNISDLLKLARENPIVENVEYSINMAALQKILEPLGKLEKMIGMETLKENVVDQIIYFIQDLHIKDDSTGAFNDYMHTAIYGPPGTGKTEVAELLGAIFSKMGILKKNKFKKVTRADLIAGYLGQTAIKTADVIKECLGGVLFIDEAYSLGTKEKKDSFSKECIDTLCEALSNHKSDLMVIIAGYEKELNDCFFNMNPGLNSRFNWRYKIDAYTSEQMTQIYEKKIKDNGWMLQEPIPQNWFESNKCYFKYYGRDIELLLSRVKIAHGRRLFSSATYSKKALTTSDLENGMKMFLSNDEIKKRNENIERSVLTTMYL
jgi:SpoVK/Ycf46/Vps4 family AAA+-type ATPase